MGKLYFRVVRLNPDRRQYQQQTIELVPDEPLLVEVESEFHLVGGGGNAITPEELKRIADKFEEIFNGSVGVNKSSWEEVSDNDGWTTPKE